MKFRLQWMLLVSLFVAADMAASAMSNRTKSWYWTGATWLLTACATAAWPIISRRSDRLVLDSLLVDCLVAVVSLAVLGAMGCARGFRWWNWAGAAVAVAGVALVGLGVEVDE